MYTYLAVLFGAAFLLLLLAYFIQQRSSEITISDLRDSMALSRAELLGEIERLEGETLALGGQIAELEREVQFERDAGYEFQALYDGARNQASLLEDYLGRRSEAMELFWQLDRAYTQGRNQRCRELIQRLEENETSPLKDFLPGEEDRDGYDYGPDWPSPAQRYQEIYDKLS